MSDNKLVIFEDYNIRREYDERSEKWYFSVIDIMQILIQQKDFKRAQSYWTTLKSRLKKEGSESVTKCDKLKLIAADGKKYLTDVADAETLLRIIQSIPSLKAEPIKLWFAKVGYERMEWACRCFKNFLLRLKRFLKNDFTIRNKLRVFFTCGILIDKVKTFSHLALNVNYV